MGSKEVIIAQRLAFETDTLSNSSRLLSSDRNVELIECTPHADGEASTEARSVIGSTGAWLRSGERQAGRGLR